MKILGLLGYPSLAAYSGREALQVARARQPNIVILDLNLPDLGGDEVLAQLRGEANLAGATFIALSGSADLEARAARARFDHHLLKPADIGKIKELLGRLAGPGGGAGSARVN